MAFIIHRKWNHPFIHNCHKTKRSKIWRRISLWSIPRPDNWLTQCPPKLCMYTTFDILCLKFCFCSFLLLFWLFEHLLKVPEANQKHCIEIQIFKLQIEIQKLSVTRQIHTTHTHIDGRKLLFTKNQDRQTNEWMDEHPGKKKTTTAQTI